MTDATDALSNLFGIKRSADKDNQNTSADKAGRVDSINKAGRVDSINKDVRVDSINKDVRVDSINKDVRVDSINKDVRVDSADKNAQVGEVNQAISSFAAKASDVAKDMMNEVFKHSDILGIKNLNPTNMNYVGQSGAHLEDRGKASRFAAYDTMEAGVNAAANQIRDYASKGLNSVNSIIDTWTGNKPGGENNPKDIEERKRETAKALGVSRDEALDFNDINVMRKFLRQMVRFESGAGFEGVVDGASLAPAARFSKSGVSGSVTLNQKTDIHVNGSGTPAATANAVTKEQNEVNRGMAREFAYVPFPGYS